MENDPFLNFISDLSNKIKVEKEHKQLIENINNSDTIDENKGSLETLILKIKEKINNIPSAEVKEIKPELSVSEIIKKDLETVVIETNEEKEADFGDFVSKLKDILSNKETLNPSVLPEEKKNTSTIKETASGNKIDYKEEIQKAIKSKSIKVEKNKEQTSSYVKELDNIKANVISETENSKVSEIKKLIEEYAEKYIKKAIVMSEYAGGGGTNAVQYANGGTMDGTLDVTGHILSGGRNISDYFGSGGGDPAVNTVVYTNSGNWNSSYTTVNTYSGAWSTGLQTLGFNESDAQLSISNGNVVSLSALSGNDINSILNYFSTNNVTISGLTVTQNLSVGGTIYSSATALVIAEYETLIGNGVNTSFTVNHNLNTDNIQVVVYDVSNNIASYPSIQILNSNSVSIGFSFAPPLNYYRVLVFGTVPSNQINAYGEIYTFYTTATGFGDIPTLSGDWNSTYTTVNSNSACWELGCQAYTNLVTNSAAYLLSGTDVYLGDIPTLSGDWNSTYTTVQSNSAGWGNISLPVPKILLNTTTSVPFLSGRASQQYSENTLGFAGNIILANLPKLTVSDFTQDVLDKYTICIEMVIFKNKNNYVVPTGTTPPPWSINFWTRGGEDTIDYPSVEVPRYNHLPVTANGQVINLALCLHGRFKTFSTPYLDSSSVSYIDFRYINTIVPFSKTNRSSSSSTKRFGYKQYKPMYVAFRYVAYLSSANAGRGQIISGPLSPTIRIVNSIWPFNTNHYQSSLKGFQVVDLNTNFNKKKFKCTFV